MRFHEKLMSVINYKKWKILCYIFVCINFLLNDYCYGQYNRRPVPKFPGTRRQYQNGDSFPTWMTASTSKTNHSQGYYWRFPSEKNFPIDQKKFITKTVPDSEVFNKQNYHHNEASPISPLVVPEYQQSHITDENGTSGNTTSQLDKKLFESNYHKHNTLSSSASSSAPTFLILDIDNGDNENEELEIEEVENVEIQEEKMDMMEEEELTENTEVVTYDPFAESLTIRIGAFFESPQIEIMSAKFISTLRKEVSKLEDEFRTMKLMKLDLDSEDEENTITNKYDVLRELQFSSVFGNLNIESLIMEIPAFDSDRVIKMCRMLSSKNVVATVALGSAPNIYAASILTQSAKVPLVAGTYTGYADQDTFQVRIHLFASLKCFVYYLRTVINGFNLQ